MAAAALEHAGDLLDRRCVPEAIAAFDRAEALGASLEDCAGGRWLGAMLLGRFEAAWRVSDRLRRVNVPDPHRLWNGEDLHGARLIVRCLHGFGDTVQMLRYAPMLNGIAARVTWQVAPRFLPLAALFPGVHHAVTWGIEAPPGQPPWDVQVECMELPYIFRTTLQNLPLPHGLQLPHSVLAETANALGPRRRPRVGLVWAAGDWNPQRSIPVALLSPLFEENFEFWSLQGGPAAHDILAPAMRDAAALCGDGLIPLAATIAHLDLVITVDTLAAHLAGVLAKPAWLLLGHAADWRWMTGRDGSPWYPTLRLFRQPHPGAWEQVVAAIRGALRTTPPQADRP